MAQANNHWRLSPIKKRLRPLVGFEAAKTISAIAGPRFPTGFDLHAMRWRGTWVIARNVSNFVKSTWVGNPRLLVVGFSIFGCIMIFHNLVLRAFGCMWARAKAWMGRMIDAS
ncbi:MAG: hypothetical protein AAFO75_13400 [Pseudomonadota bacterium]